MHDKTVRRRRAVLGLLVVLSLILLTAYSGEAYDGRLHSVQRGFLTVVSPIQDGANKALKPVRDMFGWFGDTFHAKSQRNELRKQNDQLRREWSPTRLTNARPPAPGRCTTSTSSSTTIGRSPPPSSAKRRTLVQTVTSTKATSSGIRVNDPVINGEGLVGRVATVVPDGAQVDLITDSSRVYRLASARTLATGLLQPKVGEPDDLLLQYLPVQLLVPTPANTS